MPKKKPASATLVERLRDALESCILGLETQPESERAPIAQAALEQARDRLRQLREEVDDLLDPVDRGLADLGSAIDALSEQV